MRSPVANTLNDLSALHVGSATAYLLEPGRQCEPVSKERAGLAVHDGRVIVCHGRSVAARLHLDRLFAFDLLELFAFVRPAEFCLPTPNGLADALGLARPERPEDIPQLYPEIADGLLAELGEKEALDGRDRWARQLAKAMHDGGWPWGRLVLQALGEPDPGAPEPIRVASFEIWRDLAEWSEHAPEPPAGHEPVFEDEARDKLASIVGTGAERRDTQADYSAAISAAFRPRAREDEPNLVLAEAGTGVGKTLGYLAPASLWAEKNEGAVWLSTYTRNLQHQIENELDRVYPDPIAKKSKVVVRKGRENYLCLLNLEEASRTLSTQPQFATAIGLMARWARATKSGDLQGGDFPAWLSDILGRGRTLGLADRRGECVFSACPHYNKCFIEKSVRQARRARLVIANHALVMIQAALGGVDDSHVPTRYVFDEGHHVFEAADSAFSSHLSAQETVELRRWLLGAETRRSGRARGLRRRIEELIADREDALELLDEIEAASSALPSDGWTNRIADEQPRGAAEAFLVLVRRQIYARIDDPSSPYGLECEAAEPVEGLIEAARALEKALARLSLPMEKLRKQLVKRLDEEADELDTPTRLRIEAVSKSLQRRGGSMVEGWRAMLQALETETPEEFVDWLAIDRIDGRDIDVGLHRHWIDPSLPFAETVAKKAHGLAVTSATLRDGSGDEQADWAVAEARTGAAHLSSPALLTAHSSPFDYPSQTKVFIVNDVRKDDLDQVAAAYRTFFQASGGGALGLFTAIQRLRGVYQRIAPELESSGQSLYAQHVDGMNLSTLIEIFKAEPHSCLLGTDAVRDGVDVPGESLRLIVFDRVPWPRPSILFRARRSAFGGGKYTDMQTRLRLKQAFGRLIRRADDHGVFVLLDPMMPSRLLGAFPPGVEVRRCGLAEAVEETGSFLSSKC